jgi:16S rRNA (uracil1498-N3)-methyltransferase
MHLFFIDEITENTCTLAAEDVKHARRVLRLKEADKVQCTDGAGLMIHGTIMEISRDEITVAIDQKTLTPPSPKLHIAIAPTKNMSRFEWFLEKGTELGFTDITPVYCKHSERKNIREDRLEKILIAGVKQSLNPHKALLHPMIKFEEFMESINVRNTDLFIASTQAKVSDELYLKHRPDKDVIVLIGPEGDFTTEEMQMAAKKKFKPVSLGPIRLRVETAALAAIQTIQLKRRVETLTPTKKDS